MTETVTFTSRMPELRRVYGDAFDDIPLEQVKHKRDALYAFCLDCDRWLPGSPYWPITKSISIHMHDRFEFYTLKGPDA